MKRTLTILIFLMFGTISVSGMSKYCRRTTKGIDFWFGFMDNAIIPLDFKDCTPNKLNPVHYGEIIVTSDVDADFQITIGTAQMQLGGPYHVNAHDKTRVRFDLDANPKNALHLTASDSVSVYALNFSEYTSDIALIYPTSSLGKEYFAMCGMSDPVDYVMEDIYYSGSWTGGDWARQSKSEFMIVAITDNTVIDISPTAKVKNSNAPFRIKLNKGEQYLVTPEDTTVESGGLDLTGSYIKSNNPVALFSGCIWTQNPSGPLGSPGHMFEQIPSMQTWGKKFLAVPFKEKSKDTWRILASQKGTTVRVTGQPTIILNRGEYKEFTLAQTVPSFIETDKPVLVAQYSYGGKESCDTCANQASMVIVSPVNQASERTAFVTCDYVPYTDYQTNVCPVTMWNGKVEYFKEKLDISTCEYFINVIAKDDAAGKIDLDGVPIGFNSLSGSGYGYAQLKIQPGSHLLESTEPGKGFVAYAYNYWDNEVRSYGLAQTQDLFVDLASYNNTGPEIPDEWCYGDTLKAGEDYDSYTWNGNVQTASWIIPQVSRWYTVNVTTNDGCNLTDSVELKIDRPVVDLGKDRLICIPDSTILDAGNQSGGIPFVHWLWNTPAQDSTQKITVRNAGTYEVRIIDKYGCKGNDEIKITTDPRPRLFISATDTLVCGSKSDTLSVKADKGSFTAKRLIDGDLFNGLNVNVPDYGSYTFVVRVTDNYGCYSEALDKIGFHETPVVNLGRDSTYCRSDTVVLNAGDNLIKYLWSPGGQTTQKIAATQSGTYSISVMNKYYCSGSDKAILTFVPRPQITFRQADTIFCGTKSAGLNVTADKGSFSVERLSDHYLFNSLNVNVPVYDSYKFRVIATDQYKCSTDSIINLGFHKIPTVDFNIDNTKCYGYNLDASYIGDADINRSDFTWIFGKDTISHAVGAASQVIPIGFNQFARDLKLTISDLGCFNSKIVNNIKVTPLTQTWVTDSAGCVPFTAQFKTSVTEPVTYDWNFGDGAHLNGITANPAHTYNKTGYYPVVLKVTTSSGCKNEARMDSLIYVAEIPDIAFSLRPEECLTPGDHQIFYRGSADQWDTYQWDLSAFDQEEIINNPGTSQGPFTFNMKNRVKAKIGLQVVSKYGCKSDLGEITVKRSPLFSFSVSDEKGCIPFETSFTALPTDNFDRLNYAWEFGDGSSGTGINAIHTYNRPDPGYTVGLTALSSVTECFGTVKMTGLINAYPKPLAAFSVNYVHSGNGSHNLEFNNESKGAVSYLWDFGDGTTSQEMNPTHGFSKLSRSNVLLQALNDYSCTDTVSHLLLVGFDGIFPPTAFSPNSPNAIDREFKLYADGVKPEGYHFTVISRWNDLVFEAKNEIKGWEGRLKNGEMAPAGNYVWMLDYFDTFGRPHHQTGTVTLVY